MDLSGLIFVALAVAWAAYLIPMALKRTDDLATTRAVEDFSSRLRVFGGQRFVADAPAPSPAEPAVPRTRMIASMSPANRAAARRAAARRRRVLGVLVVFVAVVAGVAALGHAPWWSVGAPVALIVAFLVTARLTVKRERARRMIEVIVPVAEQPAAHVVPTSVEAADVEETIGLTAEALAGIRAEAPITDAGSLWDPVPVTLPTYVTKPRARRTVRTIELTRSSGHDAADTKLARDADAARTAKVRAEKAEESEATPDRKAAGA